MANKSIYEMTDEEIMSMDLPPEPDDKEEPADADDKTDDSVDDVDNSDKDTDNQLDQSDDNDQIKDIDDKVEPDNKEPDDKDIDSSSGSDNKEEPKDNIEEPEEKNKDTKQVDVKNNSSDILDNNSKIEVNYEDFYKKVMAPFKANGKTISLKNAEEAIQLMQMGANYTRKMQSIAPYRKTLLMLEKANLLDENKLSFLIDVNNGNQEAIKQLLKDKQVDPLEFNTEEQINYQPGSNRVSDAEVNFKSALDDLVSTADGLQTVQEINTNWDQASKYELYKDPQSLRAIHQQRLNGMYNQIAGEVERRKTLGIIPYDMPFIKAYISVGQEMAQQRQAQSQSKNREPLAVKVATPKKNVINEAKVKSVASTTKSTPKASKQFINPLSMSDEEFMKQFGNKY